MFQKIQALNFGAFWLANLVEKEIDLAALVDRIVDGKKDDASSVGEYFVCAVYNRMIRAGLDRWTVEDGFRLTKDEAQVALRPIRHWTDSKIRCHIFTCMAALALLRIIELRRRKAEFNMTTKVAMNHMSNLHSFLMWLPGKRKAMRMLEEPDNTQAEIMRAFGWKIADGTLQKIQMHYIEISLF